MRTLRLVGVAAGILFVVLVATPAPASVADEALIELFSEIGMATRDWMKKAAEYTMKILWFSSLIAFALGCKDLLLSGGVTLDAVLALLVRYALWVGISVWILERLEILMQIPKSLKQLGQLIGGEYVGLASLLTLFARVTSPIVEFAAGLGWMDVGLIVICGFLVFVINCLCFMIMTTVLCIEIELVFISIGGLFTLGFFVLGFFRDYFMGYLRALVHVGVKLLLLSLLMGLIGKIVATWPAQIAAYIQEPNGVFVFVVPLCSALVAFYMIVKSVPNYAVAITTGSASANNNFMAAVAAGAGLGMTVWNTSLRAARTMTGAGEQVREAAKAFGNVSQALRDTAAAEGGSPGNVVGRAAWEAFRTLAAGGDGEKGARRIYEEHRLAREFGRAGDGGGAGSSMTPGGGAYPDRNMRFDLKTAQERYMEEMRWRNAQAAGMPPLDSDGKRGRS